METQSHSDFLLELQGYRLTTVEIIYFLPDFPDVLQSFIWQSLDLPPDFPRLRHFLDYWENHIEAQLFSVRVAQAEGLRITDPRLAKDEFLL